MEKTYPSIGNQKFHFERKWTWNPKIMPSFYGLVGILIFLGCGSVASPEEISYSATDFYPLDSMTLIYQVDSIIYDLEGTQRVQNTSSSLLRYQYVKELGQWWIIQSWRPTDTVEWRSKGRTSISLESGDVWESSDGVVLKKLDQPLTDGSRWEESEGASRSYTITVAGEQIIPFSVPWNVEATIGTDGYTLSDMTFDTYLVKEMAPQDVLIEYRAFKEIYALNVGMIYRAVDVLDTQCEHRGGLLENCVDEAWEDKANRGYQCIMTLKEIQ